MNDRKKNAFTLIELLVVIAIIAILAALGLPAMARAKDSGLNAACKNNLRQIGIALHLYVSDFQKYPLYAEMIFNGSWGASCWDNKLVVYTSKTPGVFNCPANKTAPKWTNLTGFTSLMVGHANPSYGYNISGCANYDSIQASLGLSGSNGGLADPPPVPESRVKAPSDMIAIADYKPQSDDDNDLDPKNLLADMPNPRHRFCANAVFCDIHVEFAKQKIWLEKSDLRRHRFNSDNQPHRELWGNNP
jgi:prepilin-type N-terminal cleavage/methylation domain-containing protein